MTTIEMPTPAQDIIYRKAEIVSKLAAVLPADAVIADPEETRAYECDALTAYRSSQSCFRVPQELAAAVRIRH